MMENTLLQEAVHLKELLLINLDLIQQQQELLAEKDRKLHVLTQENESLKCRLERMDRRMSLCKTKQGQQQSARNITTAGNESSLTLKENRKSSFRDGAGDQSVKLDGTPATLGHVSQHEKSSQELDSAKKMRLSTPAGKTAVSKRIETIVKEEKVSRVRSRSNSPEAKERPVPVSKGKGRRATPSVVSDEILTTDTMYFVQKPSNNNCMLTEPGLDIGAAVQVPAWRTVQVHSLYVMEGTENLTDAQFLKRHQKWENEEKRRKRWDVQRLRDLRLLQKQKRTDYSSEMREETVAEFISLMPDPDQVSYISVDESIPVSAFGQALPLLECKEFELPWSSLEPEPVKASKLKKGGRKTTVVRKCAVCNKQRVTVGELLCNCTRCCRRILMVNSPVRLFCLPCKDSFVC